MQNKLIAAGAGLFASGVLVGWALTADHFEHKMKSNQRLLGDIIDRQAGELDTARTLLLNDYSTEEIEDRVEKEIRGGAGVDTTFAAAFERETPNLVRSIEEVIEDAIEAKVEDAEEQLEALDEGDEHVIPEGETEAETRANLQSIIDQYTNDPDTVKTFADMAAVDARPDNTPPFVITKAKFAWDEEEGDEYDKITLTYYPREKILLDDEDDLIDDVGNLVGWRSLTRFGDESEDADVVFVRNRRLKTDFEVVRDTENQPPAHIRFGMGRDEFETHKAAGTIRFRPGTND